MQHNKEFIEAQARIFKALGHPSRLLMVDALRDGEKCVCDLQALVGHAPGGVCPFCVNAGVQGFLDCSLQRFATIYPAAGSANSAVRLTPEELAQLCPGSRRAL